MIEQFRGDSSLNWHGAILKDVNPASRLREDDT